MVSLLCSIIDVYSLIDCNLKSNDVNELGKFLRDYPTVTDVCLDDNSVADQNFHVLIRQTGYVSCI